MPTCTLCLEEKPAACFRKRSNRPSGLTTRCKDCLDTAARNVYGGKDHSAAYRKRKAEQPEWFMVQSARTRTRQKGLPECNLTPADISIPSTCPVLGIKLTSQKGKSGPQDSSPSLDRIVPALGYVKGNVRVISHRANRIKTDATVEELRRVLEDLEALHI